MHKKKLTLENAKMFAYDKIGIDLKHENRPVILDEYTLDFEWGYVFFYNGKKAIETKNSDYDYIGGCPILIDKYDGTATYVGAIGKVIDSELENYREKKGYPLTIKFPIEEDISNLPLIDQVKRIFKTGELYQIKEAMKMVETNKLFNVDCFKKIIFNNAFPDWTFEEQIAAQFKHGTIILNSKIGNIFPKDLNIFNDAKRLSFSGVKLEEITNDILQLTNLEEIEIWYSKVNQISPDIINLKNLKYIELLDSKLGKQALKTINNLKEKKNIRVNI